MKYILLILLSSQMAFHFIEAQTCQSILAPAKIDDPEFLSFYNKPNTEFVNSLFEKDSYFLFLGRKRHLNLVLNRILDLPGRLQQDILSRSLKEYGEIGRSDKVHKTILDYYLTLLLADKVDKTLAANPKIAFSKYIQFIETIAQRIGGSTHSPSQRKKAFLTLYQAIDKLTYDGESKTISLRGSTANGKSFFGSSDLDIRVNFSSRLHFPLENFIRNKLKTDFDPQVAFMSWTSHQFDLSYNLFSLDFTLSEKGLRVELVTSESRLRQKPIEILRENYSQINGKIKKYDVTNEFINYIEN